MDHQDKTIVVVGATGKQGGAVARSLLARGWQVRLLSRDPNRPPLKIFVKNGAEAVKGDLDNRASLDKALEGAYGVFSVQTYMGHGPEGEERQGKTLADAAKAKGIQHFVYSSITGVESNTGISHYESKQRIEQHIQEITLPATILRPAFFMDNFQHYFRPLFQKGKLTFAIALHPDTVLQMIGVHDIGEFAALAFEDPQNYIGRVLALAGDALTLPEVARVFGDVTGYPSEFSELPIEKVRSLSKETARTLEWLNCCEPAIDIPALRSLYPQLMSLETWLRQAGWDPMK